MFLLAVVNIILTGSFALGHSEVVSVEKISLNAGPLSFFLLNQFRNMEIMFPNFAAARPPSSSAAFR